MKRTIALLTGLATAGAIGLLLVASGCGGSAPSGAAAKTSSNRWQPDHLLTATHPLTTGRITIAIHAVGQSREHTSPATFAVEVGRPLTLTFVNYTTRPHTFTAPEPGVSAFVKAGTKQAPTTTSFTFTPDRFGVFRWYCALPCGHDMSGRVYAIIE